ncbi:MAG: hypothetical protein KBC78_03970 [Candidatus Pacebacteria bacterium]|jgi:hypothetical protein|nr:hypothetical protein [Candidatus Paceibacterota bacterium]
MTTITKEELLKKMNEIEKTHSLKERVEMMEEIKKMLNDTNQELKALYAEIKAKMEKGN